MIGAKSSFLGLKKYSKKEFFAMVQKEIISLGQRRKLPEGFGWVDHRLVRENLIENFSSEALALYLFLITVGDEDGVSWYSDGTVCRKLNFGAETLESSRHELSAGKLIAYRKPYYQVLELPRPQVSENFRKALRTGLNSDMDTECRQPAGTEGMGVSLHPPGGMYRRGEDVCDALPVSVILNAMAGGVK